ncbi:MAG: hypothetical protein UHT92_09550 [Prevotella sp.]|nr:hypothetical protein [Prevotella sp.]
MSQFAHYYIRYIHDFGPHDWEMRQQHLSALFEKDDSIVFSLGEGEDRKEYKHQVYHLGCAPQIIVMRFANNIDIPVERDFKPEVAKDEPSCFVIIDNRDNMRTVAIQKRKKAFGNPGQVAKILTDIINQQLWENYCYRFEVLPEYYPEDLYKAWEKLQQHTSALRFGVPDMSETEIRAKVRELKMKQRDHFDDSLIEPLIQLALEAKKSKYKHVYTVMPEDRKTPLYVDKTSTFVRNLVTIADALGEPVELVTSNGGTFRCFVDSEEDNTSKIVCREFNTEHLEMLFRERDKEGKRIDPEDRIKAEGEILELMNGMKHESAEEEEEQAA